MDAIKRGVEGADAVFHVGAIYKVGIPKKDREGMIDANVRGTERVLDAAHEAGVARIVYVSTVNVFGNTDGQVVDETYRRDESEGFLSCYDETKYRSHQVAEDRIGRGYPIVMVQPGGVYGPDDHSEVGNMIEQASTGKLMAKAFPDMGIMLVLRGGRGRRRAAGLRQGRDRRVLRARGRADDDGRDHRPGGRARRPQAAADDDAHAADQGARPRWAAGRAGPRLPAQPGRAGQRRPTA